MLEMQSLANNGSPQPERRSPAGLERQARIAGVFDVILCDAPWRFNTYSPKGNGKGAERHYNTMTLEELKALDVGSLASDNCALFLWCCWPSIFRDVPALLEAWGFLYRTLAFIWVKSTRCGDGFHTGLGYYTRANSEPCLLAVRGKMPVATHNVHSVIFSPVRRHSQKPDEVYSRIEQLYPRRRYLELFARQSWPGWAAWGNEIVSDSMVEFVLKKKANIDISKHNSAMGDC